MRFVYGNGDVDEQADRYLSERRDDVKQIMNDVNRYYASTEHYAPKTRLDKLSTIKTFLIDSYVILPESFWRKFATRGRKPRPVSKEKLLEPRQIRAIVALLKSRGGTVVMVCNAAGTRIGETISIELSDLSLEMDPPRIHLRAETTKNKEARVVFLTQEAKEAVEDWIQVRPHYLKNKRGAARFRQLDDPRLFPFSKENMYFVWHNAMIQLGLDERDPKTNNYVYRIHGFRKRFRTFMATKIPVDAVEVMMGQKGYLTDNYRRYTEEDLAKFYNIGQHVLMLYTERAEIAEIAAKQEENNLALQQQLSEKERQISEFSLQLAETTARLAHIEAKLLEREEKE